MRSRLSLAALALFLALTAVRPGHALDKQGKRSADQDISDAGTAFNVTGSFTLGSALLNHSYAARPDNTGLALLRYAAHADIDVLGPKLSVPLDLNLFTDRQRSGASQFSPSEFDFISGLTSTWELGPGSAELGARYERDLPVDRGNFVQQYMDARARYVYSAARIWPELDRALADGDISGSVTLGWFAWNPAYAARPDNSGRALFRYAQNVEVSGWKNRIGAAADTTFFTDKRGSNARPSELDLTPSVFARYEDWELRIAYERDMSLNHGSYTQSFIYAILNWSYDLRQWRSPGATPVP